MKWLIALVLCLVAQGVHAGSPVVVELFTSQSCDSCPPADALLARLAERPDILALDMHVTYWNGLGWRDPYSLPEVTTRQKDYGRQLGVGEIYTPQLVAGGTHQAVGSDPDAVAAAITAAEAEQATTPAVQLTLQRDGQGLVAEIGAGAGRATLWLVGFDPHHVTPVRGGENSGRTLVEANVVRELAKAGEWHGETIRLTLPLPAGERSAVLLQAPDGTILAAAELAGAG
jgi:hypothetical protein